MAPPTDRRPIVVSGPSGVGKGTLCQTLLDGYPETFVLTVSHTTRSPRAGKGEFVEHTIFNGHHYGTSRRTITEQTAKGLIVILEVDMEGVKQIKAAPGMDVRYVFIEPPSFETLEARLRSRGTNGEESVMRRLELARKELDYADEKGVYDKILVNDGLERARKELSDFIYEST